METKHTPGPWTINRIGEITSGQTRIAKVTSNGPTFGSPTTDDIANARLIAAAPDMLAALNSILEWTDDDHDKPTRKGWIMVDPHQWFERRLLMIRNAARAAIARAEGKE